MTDTPAATERVSDLRDEDGHFLGHAGSECGEHRTVGAHRAWCFQCSEWCYPEVPCKGCELPKLRAKLKEAVEVLERLRRDHGVQRGSWWDKQIQPFLESVRDLL